MPWTLTAHGECADDDERDLVDKVTKLLATPRYGADASHLSGGTHNGPVHVAAKATGKKA